MAGSAIRIRYTTEDSVKARLIQKIQFQQDSSVVEIGELPNELLQQLIADAETEVEQELRSRYAIPFRSISGNSWESLPDHSRRALRVVCDLKAVLNILETDFGDGGTFDSAAYSKATRARYEENINRLLGQDVEAENQVVKRWRKSPPLDDVLLAATNVADDGVRGTVIGGSLGQTSQGIGGYAAGQVNDPSVINFGPIRPWMSR